MKKILTILISIMMVSLLAFGLTACGPKGSEGSGEGEGSQTHTCSFEATDWWDKTGDKVFVKKQACTCGETKSNIGIEIDTADKLIKWASYVNAGKNYSYNVKFLNDIDMTGKTFTPINIYDMSGKNEYKITADSAIKISNLTIASGEISGLFGEVKSKLSITNIALDNANITGTVAGGIIAVGQDASSINLNSCAVTNSTITGVDAAGAVYGKMAATSGELTLIADKLVVTGNTISATDYAGAIAGMATDCECPQNSVYKVKITINSNETISENTATSTGTGTNMAGKIFGMYGFGSVQYKYSRYIANESTNTAFCGGVKVAREYGKTCWVSATEKGHVFEGLNILNFPDAVNN